MLKPAVRSACLWAAAGLVLGSLFGSTAFADALSPAQDKNVRAATFEVVLPKPREDSLRYERPLPMELVPFAIRNDNYEPIGTAFALDKGRYVTAAHVLAAAMSSSRGAPLVRGQDGTVHEVSEILQLSLAEDYAVFAISSKVAAKPLVTNTRPAIGGVVHAVGNALGEGIILRDGLLTSETPEARDGAWNWLRFSAAASPGNSGGPLLDEKGRAIGVVLGKSPNENLNYALPIGRVLRPAVESVAELKLRQSFGLTIASASIVTSLDKTIALPMSYSEFASAYVAAINGFHDESLARFVSENEDRLFPRGDAARNMLTHADWASTLQIIAEQTNGEWDAVRADNVVTVDLPPDGELHTAQSSGISVMRLFKPSLVPLEDLFTDSEAFMDLVLKGFRLSRSVADQNVRITSLGRATLDEWHIDRYGRKWQLRTWPLGYSDAVVIALALPKPEGADMMFVLVPSMLQHAVTAQLKFLADYAYVGYYGSLRDWQAYLALPDLHPRIFKDLEVGIDIGKRVRFTSPRFRLDLDNWLLDIGEQSRLDLQFSYYMDDGKVVWDVVTLMLSEDSDEDTYIKIARRCRPAPSASSDETKRWADLLGRKGDYSGYPRYDPPSTTITKVLNPAASQGAEAGATPDFLYTVTHKVRQMVHPTEMASMLDRAVKAVDLLE